MTTLALSGPQKTGRWQPAKMHWWYDAILDLMMAHPEKTKKDIAAELGATEQAIYLITTSDIFKARWEQRRLAFSDQLDASIHQKLSLVADKSLEIIGDIIEKKRDSIPLMQLVEVQDKVLTRLGYGIKPEAKPLPAVVHQTNVQVNSQPQPPTTVVVPASLADLEAARAALRRSEEIKLIETREEALRGVSSPSVAALEAEGDSQCIEGNLATS